MLGGGFRRSTPFLFAKFLVKLIAKKRRSAFVVVRRRSALLSGVVLESVEPSCFRNQVSQCIIICHLLARFFASWSPCEGSAERRNHAGRGNYDKHS